MQFIDECKLEIKAGDGGNGTVAWRREAHYPEGGPWGGDGGDGGDVIIIGDNNYSSLFHIRYTKKIKATDGERGDTKMMFGRNGLDEFIHVPLGTQVIDVETNELIVDIIEIGQKYTIAKGGRGGHGNAFFKSSFNKAPTLYENGDLGEGKVVLLKMKYIADIGLVGLPNAGKSSLISAMTNARPKIANYQFTTVSPVLGVIEYNDKQIIVADIPGLIEDAHIGKGLGYDFLKHIERCHILVHVISLDKNDHENINEAFDTIQNELASYDKSLKEKELIVVCNKIDVEDAQTQLNKITNKIKTHIISVSAKEKINVKELSNIICDKVIEYQIRKEAEIKKDDLTIIELRQEKFIDKSFTFEIDEAGRYIVKSKYLSYWLHKIPLRTKDNLVRFNQKMQSCDIENKLKKQGAKSKDVIVIDEVEFELD